MVKERRKEGDEHAKEKGGRIARRREIEKENGEV
jgi:hypothetical protein